MFLETARSKSRSRAPPAALRGRSPRGRRLGGRAPPATSPERWGRSWASRPSRCAVAARALTPIHSDSAPPSPCAGLWRVFEWRAGQGVGAARSPAGARTRPLDATGATQACRPVRVSAPLPPAPLPPRQAPAAGGAYRRAVQGAPPAWGSRGAQPLGPAQRTKNPLPKASISALRASLFGSSRPPEGGLNQETEGEPRKATNSGVLGFPM